MQIFFIRKNINEDPKVIGWDVGGKSRSKNRSGLDIN
jgi:hypothetical protein